MHKNFQKPRTKNYTDMNWTRPTVTLKISEEEVMAVNNDAIFVIDK